MKLIPTELQTHLDSGATTLANCWKVTRRDGSVYGFTDHDNPLSFDGCTYEAASGFIGSESLNRLGLSVDTMEVHAALNSEAITEAELSNGLYDNAEVELYLVNWADTSQRLLLKTGNIGEVRRGELAFMAEIRGLAHHLQQPEGRVYQSPCDAVLGDTRCGVDLNSPQYTATATVASPLENGRFTATGLVSYPSNWFREGRLTWLTGTNANAVMEVRAHKLEESGIAELLLWRQPALPPEAGETFTIQAGCDLKFATCREKFTNSSNFRGFPHIPGNDFLIASPK